MIGPIASMFPLASMKDDDLKELRDRREWIDALTEIKGGLSRDMKIDLRSEAKVRLCSGVSLKPNPYLKRMHQYLIN